MNIKSSKAVAAVALLGCGAALAKVSAKVSAAPRETILYRVRLEGSPSRTVTVRQSGQRMTLVLQGWGKPIALAANGGGTSTCRTIIEHRSGQARITLSLAIPDPCAACRHKPSFVTIQSRAFKIALREAEVRTTSGAPLSLRSAVRKSLGEIEAA